MSSGLAQTDSSARARNVQARIIAEVERREKEQLSRSLLAEVQLELSAEQIGEWVLLQKDLFDAGRRLIRQAEIEEASPALRLQLSRLLSAVALQSEALSALSAELERQAGLTEQRSQALARLGEIAAARRNP